MTEDTMQILFHEALPSLLEQPTLMVPWLSALWVMETLTTNPTLSIDRLIQREGLCAPHSQHGDVTLHCTPQEGSSLVFLSQ